MIVPGWGKWDAREHLQSTQVFFRVRLQFLEGHDQNGIGSEEFVEQGDVSIELEETQVRHGEPVIPPGCGAQVPEPKPPPS